MAEPDAKISVRSARAVINPLRHGSRCCRSASGAARPFPVEPVRTLDAIHLATLEVLGEVPQLVTVVTRDARMGENARAMGYGVE